MSMSMNFIFGGSEALESTRPCILQDRRMHKLHIVSIDGEGGEQCSSRHQTKPSKDDKEDFSDRVFLGDKSRNLVITVDSGID